MSDNQSSSRVTSAIPAIPGVKMSFVIKLLSLVCMTASHPLPVSGHLFLIKKMLYKDECDDIFLCCLDPILQERTRSFHLLQNNHSQDKVYDMIC